VGIYIEGDGWCGVPKLSLNIFDVFPVLKAEAGMGMPEIVKADGGTGRGLDRGAKMPTQHILVVDMVPGFIRENQVKVILGAGQAPFL
jgi:hypothetical protein